MPEMEQLLSFTPSLPTFSQARVFGKVIVGTPYLIYRSMTEKLWEQAGNPRETVDWTDPEEWIPKRLSDLEQSLAFKIWRETKGIVNPRHTRGCWYFFTKRNLIKRDNQDLIQLTKEGETFLYKPEDDLVARIDHQEGLLMLLQIVSEHSPCKRADILPDYVKFCNNSTTYHGESVQKSSLYDRLMNLIDRDLIRRSGVIYEISDHGVKYLSKNPNSTPGNIISTVQSELLKIINTNNTQVRKKLADHLSRMDPYKFEKLDGLLLQEMGYTDILVTSQSNDRGVDVVANIELGISSIREVVQVKRHADSLNRTVLDMLRGSLHRFKAFRGTIISTGTFSSGAKSAALESGAAPITLIDGKKLLDLLIEYNIGVNKKSIEFFEFEDSKLMEFEDVNTLLDKPI